MGTIGDFRHPGPGQDPASDSEVDFDDEREEFPEPDAVENREVGFEFDDPEAIASEGVED